jgi:hypothetical protein
VDFFITFQDIPVNNPCSSISIVCAVLLHTCQAYAGSLQYYQMIKSQYLIATILTVTSFSAYGFGLLATATTTVEPGIMH